MYKKTLSLILGSTIIASTAVQADCPTLNQKQLSFYLCPVVGAVNVLPQGFTAMVYTRPMQTSLGDICKNIYGSAAKAIFGKEKDYDGVEKAKTNGKLVCKYSLPQEWQRQSGLTKGEFLTEAVIDAPAHFSGTACHPLTFENVTDLMCDGSFQVRNGPQWSLKSKDIASAVCKFGKGLLAKGSSALGGTTPTGKIYGQIDEAQSTPFTHTCEYTYHERNTERKLEINGTLSMQELRAINERIRTRGN